MSTTKHIPPRERKESFIHEGQIIRVLKDIPIPAYRKRHDPTKVNQGKKKGDI
jgi:hypothetical protein